MTIILTVVATITGIAILYLVWFGVKFYIEVSKLTPLDTQEVIKNIFVLRDTYANMYFYKTGEKYIAIDAGNKPRNILREMKKLQINPDDVIAVFITHTDYDHIAGVHLFPNAQIYISEKEVQMIDGSTPRMLFYKNRFKAKYKTISENEDVEAGNSRVKGILVPGHTYGLMCYLVDDKYLFTGDAMSIKNGKVDIYNHFFNKDSEMLKKSLRKLARYDGVKFVFTAHYKYTDSFDNAFSNWK